LVYRSSARSTGCSGYFLLGDNRVDSLQVFIHSPIPSTDAATSSPATAFRARSLRCFGVMFAAAVCVQDERGEEWHWLND
jgi:hypothetical protein